MRLRIGAKGEICVVEQGKLDASAKEVFKPDSRLCSFPPPTNPWKSRNVVIAAGTERVEFVRSFLKVEIRKTRKNNLLRKSKKYFEVESSSISLFLNLKNLLSSQ